MLLFFHIVRVLSCQHLPSLIRGKLPCFSSNPDDGEHDWVLELESPFTMYSGSKAELLAILFYY